MSVGNAWKYAPARQARLQQDMQNPEYMRRKEVYRKARGPEAKALVAHWNVEWNLAGRPADFPDFPAWKAERAAKALRQSLVSANRVLASADEAEFITNARESVAALSGSKDK